MKFEIDKDLLEGIINYLAQRPWMEVQQLIQGINGCAPIEEKEVKE